MGLTGVAVPILYAIVMILTKEFFSFTVQEQVHQICVVVASVAIVGIAVWAFATARRRGLLSRAALYLAGVTGLGIVVVSIALRPTDLWIVAYPMIVAFAALVVMPWATAPLALAWNRHR